MKAFCVSIIMFGMRKGTGTVAPRKRSGERKGVTILKKKKQLQQYLPIRDYGKDHKYTQPYKYLSSATPLA